MKWVALVTVLGIGTYTWLTLEFRKPEPSSEPWFDQRARAEVAALEKAGWAKSEVPFEPVVEFPASRGNVSIGPAMPIVSLLRNITLDPWNLPIEVTGVVAPAEWSARQPYTVYLKLELDTDRMQVGAYTVFRSSQHIILVPSWAPVPGDLVVRTRTASGRLLFNAGDVPPGDYTVTVVAIKACATWHLTVHGG